MAKKVKQQNPDPYDSDYYPTNDLKNSGEPAITAALQLGDNSAFRVSAAGVGWPEYLLNGTCGQLAWGTTTISDPVEGTYIRQVNSDVNYPSPSYCPVRLLVPPGSSPQTPTKLAVGTRPTIEYTADPYGAIAFVVVEAFVHVHGEAPPAECVKVQWYNLSVAFVDNAGHRTINSLVSSPLPGAGVGNTSPYPWHEVPKPAPPGHYCSQAALVVIPSTHFVGGAVGVEIRGGIQLVSTDAVYSNYGRNLAPASMEGRILIWEMDPGGGGKLHYPPHAITTSSTVPIPAPGAVADDVVVRAPARKRKRV